MALYAGGQCSNVVADGRLSADDDDEVIRCEVCDGIINFLVNKNFEQTKHNVSEKKPRFSVCFIASLKSCIARGS